MDLYLWADGNVSEVFRDPESSHTSSCAEHECNKFPADLNHILQRLTSLLFTLVFLEIISEFGALIL